MKKVSIIGATVIGNRGAEAMLSTVIGRIKEKYPKSNFYIYSYFPNDDKKLLKNHSDIVVYNSTPLYLVCILFPLSLVFGFLRLVNLEKLCQSFFPDSIVNLWGSDVLVDVAGVSFMDGREIFLPFNILTILPSMLVGTPVVKLAQGLGTFNNLATKISARLFLSQCKQIFARGDLTYGYVDDFFKHRKNYQQAGDVAFSFKQGDSLTIENQLYVKEILEILKNKKEQHKDIVGVCPSSVVYQKSLKDGINYINITSKIIIDLLQNTNTFVVLFPNATREQHTDKFRNNDLPVIKMIQQQIEKEGYNSSQVLPISKDINTDSIRSVIDLCDTTIVSRFHAMVASLSLSTPVVVLGWSHKYLEVMKQFDMQEFVYDYKANDIQLTQKVIELLQNKETYIKKILNALPKVRKESYKQFEYLFKEIQGK